MDKIAFFGYKNTLGYRDIGGTQSIVRRISNELKKSCKVYHLSYGHSENSYKENINDIEVIQFNKINSMLSFLVEQGIRDSILVYIRPRDYLKIFLSDSKKITKIHSLITGLNTMLLKRYLFIFLNVISLNGNFFCISKRIFKKFKLLSSRSVLILPPVEDEFFNFPQIKDNKKYRIAFMGRLDYGKGADIAIDFFKRNNLDRNMFEFYVYGYSSKRDPISLSLHKELLHNYKYMKYIEAKESNGHSKNLSKDLAKIIDNVDLFFLPYRTINSTIDTPLVPLEIMARGGQFISTKLEQLEHINFFNCLLNLDQVKDVDLIERHIQRIKVNSNRKGYMRHVNELKFRTSDICSKILDTLS